MTDDFVTDGILPDDTSGGDEEFDPNEFESDDILDDVEEVPDDLEDLSLDMAGGAALTDDEDEDDEFRDE